MAELIRDLTGDAPTIRDIMTGDPITLEASATILEAAQAMRDADIGDVIVLRDGEVAGILTDRDIVVRAVAEEQDLASMTVWDVCTQEVHTVSPDDTIEDALDLMREHAIRRLPVVDDGRAVGAVSLGDLAGYRDPRSALGQISEAAPNN
jgi:CBS domain-containing protein